MNRTGSGILTVFFKYLKYRWRSGHRKGRGIHSPFVFELVSKVIYNHDRKMLPASISNFHRSMLQSQELIHIEDHGAGSRVSKKEVRKASSIAKSSSIKKKYGEILFRLSAWYVPETILELGTGIGISTAYLSAGHPESRIFSVEGSKEKSEYARKQVHEYGVDNVDFIHATFESCLDDLLSKMTNHCLIFIDGDHRYEPTVNTVQRILDNDKLEEVVIILDDIYWSNGMERAWKELCDDTRIDISIDLFFMGFLICQPGMKKQHFNITL